MAKNINKKNKNDNIYNAENEIIIGVTTKQKKNAYVKDKKNTSTNNTKATKKKNKKINIDKEKMQKKIQNNNHGNSKTKTSKVNNKKSKDIKLINLKKKLISIVIFLIILLGGSVYYLTTPVFNIANIEVYGNEKNSIETYISLSRINLNATNIFAIAKKNIKKNIKENSYVEDVKVVRKLPNIIQLYITERKVSYQINYTDKYILIDNQGYILEISNNKKDVPIIDGFATINKNISVGQRLIDEDLIKLNVVAKFINHCQYNLIENKLTNIDVSDDKNYIVYFKNDKKTVYLGDATNLNERLSLLKTILNNEKDKEIEIFMNGDLNKDDVYIRYLKEEKGE